MSSWLEIKSLCFVRCIFHSVTFFGSYFEIILDLPKSRKDNTTSLCALVQLHVSTCIPVVCLFKTKIDVGALLLTKLQSLLRFPQFFLVTPIFCSRIDSRILHGFWSSCVRILFLAVVRLLPSGTVFSIFPHLLLLSKRSGQIFIGCSSVWVDLRFSHV